MAESRGPGQLHTLKQHQKQGCPVLAGLSQDHLPRLLFTSGKEVSLPFQSSSLPSLGLYVHSHSVHTSLGGRLDQQEPAPGPTHPIYLACL